MRLGSFLHSQQPHDQTRFKPNSGVDDAFVTVEILVSKSLEGNFDVWCASLDLKKAFDRIDNASAGWYHMGLTFTGGALDQHPTCRRFDSLCQVLGGIGRDDRTVE